MSSIIKRFVIVPLTIFATLLIGRDVLRILASQFYLADYRYLEKRLHSPKLKADFTTKSSAGTGENKPAKTELKTEDLFDALKKATSFQPDNSEPYSMAGNKYLGMLQKQLRNGLFVEKDGRLIRRASLQTREIAPKTLEYFIKAVEKNPLDSNSWLQLAWSAGLVIDTLEIETFPETSNEIRRVWQQEIDQLLRFALWLKPSDPFPHYSAGLYYLTQGDRRFTQLFRRVLELNKSADMARILGLVWTNPKVGKDFSLLEEMSPEDYFSYNLLLEFALNKNLITDSVRITKKLEDIKKKEAASLIR